MATYREIVTKAVLGKGKKHFINVYTLKTEAVPSTVLGCWVINHKFKGYQTGDKIVIDGSFDVNIWYSFDNDSKTGVVSKKVDYNETVKVKVKEESDLTSDMEIIVRPLKQPNCLRVGIKNGEIEYEIEKELGVELVGDTKLKIAVETDEEPWETIEDEVTDEVTKEIDDNVKENFIK